MLAQTETNIEYNASCNRIQTILPHVDMEQYTISNIITAPITKLQAKLSALISEINYQHIFNMLPTADASNTISSRSRNTHKLPTNLLGKSVICLNTII